MELIILIILLAVIGCRSLGNNVNASYYKTQQNNRQEIRRKIHIDFTMCQEFHNHRWEYIESISDELKEVYGAKWKELFESEYPITLSYSRHEERYYNRNIWCVAYEIYCSTKGYIVSDMLPRSTPLYPSDSVEKVTFDNYDRRDSIAAVSEAKRKERGMTIAKIIERNMREKHPEMNLKLGISKSDSYYEGAFIWNYVDEEGSADYSWNSSRK